jgi:hypothetical protein
MDFINKLESKQKGYITGEYALDLIKSLARSQGCWGRMLRDLYENDAVEDFKEWVESQKFTNDLDLILALEGN